jgi:hypothetical protein
MSLIRGPQTIDGGSLLLRQLSVGERVDEN